jgi:hypothetical protein
MDKPSRIISKKTYKPTNDQYYGDDIKDVSHLIKFKCIMAVERKNFAMFMNGRKTRCLGQEEEAKGKMGNIGEKALQLVHQLLHGFIDHIPCKRFTYKIICSFA